MQLIHQKKVMRFFIQKKNLSELTDRFKIIIGSANLTFPGLVSNIETGLYCEILKTEDYSEMSNLLGLYDNLPNTYPDHIFRLHNLALELILTIYRLQSNLL